jgi:uracil-DNA glycosylase
VGFWKAKEGSERWLAPWDGRDSGRVQNKIESLYYFVGSFYIDNGVLWAQMSVGCGNCHVPPAAPICACPNSDQKIFWRAQRFRSVTSIFF